MAGLTLDRVLAEAEALPADEQEMLESLLRQRRIESWRWDTAAEAKSAIKAFQSGKLKSQSAEKLIASLRKSRGRV
jgi:CHASE3 domain sensor protein